MYCLQIVNKNEGSSTVGYFQTYAEAENFQKLIVLHSEAFDKCVDYNNQHDLIKLTRICNNIERMMGLKLPHKSDEETFKIKEIEISILQHGNFNLFEHNLKTFNKPRKPLFKEGDQVTIKGHPNGLGYTHPKYLGKQITGTITSVSEYELGTSYMNIPEGFSYMIKSDSFENSLGNELWFHESNIE